MRHRILQWVTIWSLTAGLIGCCSGRGPKLMTTSVHPTPCDHLAHNNIIVYENHKLTCDDAYVGKTDQNTIEWVAPGHRLRIEFVGENPFENVPCGGSACSAFQIITDRYNVPFKYRVYIDGKMVLDPNVIIKP